MEDFCVGFQTFQLGLRYVLSTVSLGIKFSLLLKIHYFKLHWIVYQAYIKYTQCPHFNVGNRNLLRLFHGFMTLEIELRHVFLAVSFTPL